MNPILRHEVMSLIELAFNGDEELLSQYHISPGDLEHCVAHTMNFINENANYYKEDMSFYSICRNNKEIGYAITIKNDRIPNELYSFGVNKNFRTKEILTEWLRQLDLILGQPYYIVLWSKNTRAINFFEKNGFVVERTNKYLNDETKTLIIKPKNTTLCQRES